MRATVRPPTAMIGAGGLARALLPTLVRAGYPLVAIASRTGSSARAARRRAGVGRVTTDAIRAARPARLVLLAVPDREIGALAGRLAAARDLDWNGRTVLHHAGALGVEVLRPLAKAGAAVGVLHPLQCLGPSDAAASRLPGSRARIEGDVQGARVARRLARDLGLKPLRLPRDPSPAQRAAYHAAASLVSNDLVALLSYAGQSMQQAGLGAQEALDALLPLADGTLHLARQEGLDAALTGPAVRGDTETLDAHGKSLRRISRHAAEVHRLLSAHLRELARQRRRTSGRSRRRGV